MIKIIQFSSCEGQFTPAGWYIDDSIINVSVNDTVYLSGCTEVKGGNTFCFEGCAIIIAMTVVGTQPANTVILNNYGPNECEQCQIDNANFLVFNECFGTGFNEIFVPIDDFTGTPTIGDVFLLSFYFGYYGNLAQFTGCFEFVGFATNNGSLDFDIILTSQTPKSDCQNCLETSPIVYEVIECLSETTYFISFPSTGFEDHLITFTDLSELTQFCGIVREQINQPVTGILISDLGLLNEGNNDCNTCLENVAEKRKLVNCLNPSEEVIVWASSLFEAGESTHLSNGDGCYQISPDVVPPETPVDINELADYDPQENCEDCFECYGLQYDFQSCEPIEVCGPINLISTNPQFLSIGRDFVIDPSNNYALIPFVNFMGGRIGQYDLTAQTFVSQSSPILSSPQSLDIDYANNIVCVSNTAGSDVTFFDYTNLNNSFSLPMDSSYKVYFNLNDNFFYVTSDQCCVNPGIRVFSGLTYNTMTQIQTFGFNNDYRDIVQIGTQIYALNTTNGQLEIYNISPGPSYTLSGSYSLPASCNSFSYDGANTLYLAASSSFYIKFNTLTPGLTIINYDRPSCCGVSLIKVNNITNRIYITDSSSNFIYEFDKTTDTLINTYSNQLGDDGISQVYGIALDSTGGTWFSSFDDVFQLGCTDEIVSGTVESNEYLSAGSVFFNYQLSACCEITSISNLPENDFFGLREYVSMVQYEDCETCTGTTHELFYCESCDGFFSGVLAATGGTYSVGNFVRAHWGNSHFSCFEIIEPYTGNQFVDFSFDAENNPEFSSCEECQSGLTIGLTIVNCDTLVSQQVNVTLSDWQEIAGFPFFTPNFVFSDEEGTCYQVVNACPIDNDNPLFNIQNFYINQFFCRLANEEIPLTPITAGTPYETCLVCCPCDSGGTITSIAVPHPTWTNGFGRSIVQASMVLLGGNGLNS